jgi:subfamily B ATP-binding cassette protein MsbA
MAVPLVRTNAAYWSLAKEMLRFKGWLIAALSFALISAAGLGAGLVGIVVVLDQILPSRADDEARRSFRDQAAERLAELPAFLQPPPSWLQLIPQEPYHAVIFMVSLLGVLTVLGAAANFLHMYFALTVVTKTVARVRERTYQAVLLGRLDATRLRSPSETVSRIVQDANFLSRGFSALVSRAVAQLSKGLAALVAAVLIEWRLALVCILVGPILAVIVRKLGKRIRRASRGAMRGRADLLDVATQALQGFRVVKVYSGETRELGRFRKHNDEVVAQELRARRARAVSTPIVEVLALLVVGVLAVIAAKAILDGQLAPQEFLGALGSLAFAGNALKPLTGVVQQIQISDAAAQRIRQVIDEAAEPSGPELRTLPRHADSIRFDNVTLRYPGQDEPALADVSFDIPYGSTTAIVGPNGSGKTTLLSLVPALFQPDEGRVLIDGVDLRDADPQSIRTQIGVVTQDVVLFSGSVFENVRYGKPGATRDDVIDALRRAHALDFVEAMPGGLDADIGERGSRLSGGQRQRLSIARAILRDPAILIMDEATSMIDAESEAKITAALAEFGARRTVLVVAHRLSTVANADRIVVLDAGRVIDIGTHAELLERNELFRSLANHQLAPAVPRQ